MAKEVVSAPFLDCTLDRAYLKYFCVNEIEELSSERT